MNTHVYEVNIEWTGNLGTGTSSYRDYERSHTISAKGKAPILASSDSTFRGDGACYNPEELLVASLSSCHMLWFLHLCADAGIIVTTYSDSPIGLMHEGDANQPGRFSEVTLRPEVGLLDTSQVSRMLQLHEDAHKLCFIANSVNFPVQVNPVEVNQ